MLCGLLKSAVVAPLALLGIKSAKAAITVTPDAQAPNVVATYDEKCGKCDKTFKVRSLSPFSSNYPILPTQTEEEIGFHVGVCRRLCYRVSC